MTHIFRLQDLYLCPGDESGAHVTDNSVACGCGNSNLASLARILDRNMDEVVRTNEEYDGICADLPSLKTIQRQSWIK